MTDLMLATDGSEFVTADDYVEHVYPLIDEAFRKEFTRIQKSVDLPFEIGNAGKHFRPALALLCNKACGGHIDRWTVDFAMIPEICHQLSILQDDVIDGDDERRGDWAVHKKIASTVNATPKIASALAILLGDMSLLEMIKKALELGPDVGARVAKLTVLAGQALVTGVTKELRLGFEGRSDPALLHDIMYLKNGVLFALACQLGAISAKAAPGREEACRVYGKNIGLIHQLADDYVDVVKSVKTGEPVGDVKARRPTLPLVALAEHDFSGMVNDYLNGKAEWVGETMKEPLALATKDVDALFAQFRSEAQEQVGKILPVSSWTTLMLMMPDFVWEKMKEEVE